MFWFVCHLLLITHLVFEDQNGTKISRPVQHHLHFRNSGFKERACSTAFRICRSHDDRNLINDFFQIVSEILRLIAIPPWHLLPPSNMKVSLSVW